MTSPSGRITRDDLEARFRSLQGEVDVVEHSVRDSVVKTAVIVGAVIVAAAFVLGSRRGRKRRTVVEIRRF